MAEGWVEWTNLKRDEQRRAAGVPTLVTSDAGAEQKWRPSTNGGPSGQLIDTAQSFESF